MSILVSLQRLLMTQTRLARLSRHGLYGMAILSLRVREVHFYTAMPAAVYLPHTK